MGLWDTRQSCFDNMVDGYTVFAERLIAFDDHKDDAYIHYILAQDHEAIFDIIEALQDCIWSFNWMSNYNSDYSPPWVVPYYFQEYAGGVVDMDAILNAMLVAEPDEVMKFIGIVDAFKQSIWNQPFNQEMYAALARGFMEWE